MRFSIAAVLALASAVLAGDPTPGFDAISSPANGEKVPAGSNFDIKWDPTAAYDGTVSISLLGGSSQKTLQIIGTPIAKGVDNSQGTYSWAVAKTLGTDAVYGLQLTWDKNTTVFQYSFPFAITGASIGGSTTSTGSTTSQTFISNSTTSATETSGATTPTGSSSVTITAGGQTTAAATTSTKASQPTSSTTKSTNGAAPTIGSTLALFGGLAMAVFAL